MVFVLAEFSISFGCICHYFPMEISCAYNLSQIHANNATEALIVTRCEPYTSTDEWWTFSHSFALFLSLCASLSFRRLSWRASFSRPLAAAAVSAGASPFASASPKRERSPHLHCTDEQMLMIADYEKCTRRQISLLFTMSALWPNTSTQTHTHNARAAL